MTSLFRPEVVEYRRMRLHGEVVLTQSLPSRLFALALIATVVVAACFVAFGSYARVETVPGILVTEYPTSKVIVPVPGVLKELLVKEGSQVRKGDRIALIELDRRRASGRGVAADSLASLKNRRDLGEGAITLSNRHAESERRRLKALVAATKAQGRSLQSQISLQEQVVASNQRMFDQIGQVVDRGFVSKVELERRRQTLISSEQALAGLHQQLLERQAQAESLTGQIASLDAENDRAVSDIQSSLQTIAQQQAQLEGEQAYIVTASISGRVTALQAVPGRVVAPDKPMMVIVPEKSPLKAEIFATSKAIGFVHVGQETRLLYDAFPYQRFGSFVGRIESISRTAMDPRDVDPDQGRRPRLPGRGPIGPSSGDRIRHINIPTAWHGTPSQPHPGAPNVLGLGAPATPRRYSKDGLRKWISCSKPVVGDVRHIFHRTRAAGLFDELWPYAEVLGDVNFEKMERGALQELELCRSISKKLPLSDGGEDFINALEQINGNLLPNLGSIRTTGVRIAPDSNGVSTLFPHWSRCKMLLHKVADFIMQHRGHPTLSATVAYIEILHAHPFVDGNGRTARIVYNLIQRQAGSELYVPIKLLGYLSKESLTIKIRRAYLGNEWQGICEFMTESARVTQALQ